jgi:hypothetical protein
MDGQVIISLSICSGISYGWSLSEKWMRYRQPDPDATINRDKPGFPFAIWRGILYIANQIELPLWFLPRFG